MHTPSNITRKHTNPTSTSPQTWTRPISHWHPKTHPNAFKPLVFTYLKGWIDDCYEPCCQCTGQTVAFSFYNLKRSLDFVFTSALLTSFDAAQAHSGVQGGMSTTRWSYLFPGLGPVTLRTLTWSFPTAIRIYQCSHLCPVGFPQETVSINVLAPFSESYETHECLKRSS